jgi:hypothetical protein
VTSRQKLSTWLGVALVILTMACGGQPGMSDDNDAPDIPPPHVADNIVKPGPGDHVLSLTIRAFVSDQNGGLEEDVIPIILSLTARNGEKSKEFPHGRPLLADDLRPMLDWSIRDHTPLQILMSQAPAGPGNDKIKADVFIRSEGHPDTIFKCYWDVDGVNVLTQVTARLGSFEGKGARCGHTMIFH